MRTRSLPLWLLPFSLGWLANTAAAYADDSGAPAAGAEQATATMSHGPMLGRPRSHGMTVWARTTRPAELMVKYRDTRGVGGWRSSAAVATTIEHDLCGVVQLKGLAPDAQYDYAVYVDGRRQFPAGDFHTLPDPQELKDPELNPEGLFNFSFQFACCNNQSPTDGLGPTLPAFDTLNRDVAGKVDFAILNGDWIYEEDRDYPPEAWRRQVGLTHEKSPAIVDVMPQVCGVWQNYKTYAARAQNLRAWHRRVPSYFTFDDHELVNDIIASGETGYRNRRSVFRDIAIAGWFDYLGWSTPAVHQQPVQFGRCRLADGSDVLFDPDADFSRLDLRQAGNLHVLWGTPDSGVKDVPTGDVVGGDPNARVYDIVKVIDPHRLRITPAASATGESAYTIGRRSYGAFRVGNCEFFLLDTRSHRQLHDLQRPDKPGLSMLGNQQADWLLRAMQASDADFFFVVSSVNFMVPHVGGGGHHFDAATKDDAWTAFLDERERLIDAWDALGKPVFVLTGDLHNSFAVKITDKVWEFAAGPHNSVNHRLSDEGDRPLNGAFQHGPRPCEVRWSTTAWDDIPRDQRMFPHYCVARVTNVLNNPVELGGTRAIAYPKPIVTFTFYNALTGEPAYAESILSGE
ncbi:PhoD-like phosphatase [Pirellulimonas nuda]|uniref:PhoD-like phosphatase n=1 Tax=Pirellulimonas nuda TaxID=2528009 RepID=A0A518DGS9_9BACT|nr:alkaline phosphatase D family protein [Pirellulimonas nuda]QDU90685.1 PhoD-like phosphatase [Pirellulimonas nuda]